MSFFFRFINSRNKSNLLHSFLNHYKFFVLETIKSVLFPMPKMKILFSAKPDWEKKIRNGFRFTGHELTFNAFTPENIRNCELVVPLTIADLRTLNQNRKLIENIAIPIPCLSAVNICDDKYLFIQTLKQGGFGHVMPMVGNELPYPYILKKKTSFCGNDSYIIATAEDALKYKGLIDNADFFCQEIISDINEFATHILFKNNKIISSITIKYEFPKNTAINGKDKFIAKNIGKCQHLTLFSSILTLIGFEGLCCFDYKVVDGKPFIFEINPRFGGSLCRFFFSFINKTTIATVKD